MSRRPPPDGPPRLASVWCPHWPVVAAGAEPDVPAAVVHANRVMAASPAAFDEGVRPGHRRREAQRACPSLVVLPHDPARDARLFEPVLRALEAVTARLEPTRPGVVTFATRGPARYHGGDEPLARRIVEVVADALGPLLAVGGAPGVGIADGRLAVLLAARRSASGRNGRGHDSGGHDGRGHDSGGHDGRHGGGHGGHGHGGRTGGPMIVPAGASAAFLAPYPVGVLADPEVVPELDGPLAVERRDLVDLLGRLGLTTFGAFAQLPSADVVARFGPVGTQAHRQAAALDDRPPAAFAPPPAWAVTLELEPPTHDSGPVVFAAKALADQLFARLARHGVACTEVLVTVETEHGERHERTWRRQPALGPAAVVERVRWQLEGWAAAAAAAAAAPPARAVRGAVIRQGVTDGVNQLASAGITLLRLSPTEVVPDGGRQLEFWGGNVAADERAWRAVARMVAHLAPEAVQVPVWRGGRGAAAPWALVPAVSTDPDARARAEAVRPPAGAGPHPGRLPDPLPAVVFAEARPAELLDAAGGSVTVGGRGLVSEPPVRLAVDGRPSRPVTGWAGPWPVEERWWDAATARRLARLHVVTDDGAAWLVSREAGRWWAEAAYR